jgi:hypothetical protein
MANNTIRIPPLAVDWWEDFQSTHSERTLLTGRPLLCRTAPIIGA